jgi:hypothetical protein
VTCGAHFLRSSGGAGSAAARRAGRGAQVTRLPNASAAPMKNGTTVSPLLTTSKVFCKLTRKLITRPFTQVKSKS